MASKSTNEQLWKGDQGEVVAKRPAPGVVLYVFRGRMEESFVASIEAFAQEALVGSSGKLDVFFDTEAMTAYHPKFRQKMTAWHERFKPSTRSAHVLVTSSLVAMAISIVNLVTGGFMTSHAKRSSFEAQLSGACQVSGAA